MAAVCPISPVRPADSASNARQDCNLDPQSSPVNGLNGVEEEKDQPNRDPRGPSMYIPVSELAGAYLGDNIAAVMGIHPEYLHIFWKTQHQLLRMDGALSLPERHYVAIMAAARHQCIYLVSLHSSCFLQVGGDPRWLEGIQQAPIKLRVLNDLNKFLAHRPWMLAKEHIALLLRPCGGNSWSLAELIHAIVLLTHFHALSSFIMGCGIRTPQSQLSNSRPPSPVESNETLNSAEEAERVVAEMLKLNEEGEEATREEMETRFEKEKIESVMVTANGRITQCFFSPAIYRFLEHPEFGYIDFTRRGEQAPPTFRAHEFTWDCHGYSLMHGLYSEIGQLLDEKFQVSYNLTYHTIATHQGVDTSRLRRAIWNYIQCIYGIRYDDYDYGEVNHLLERSLKVYMKTVTCHPERVTHQLYKDFWRQFKHSEKVHLNFLLLEAKLQAALLYVLRAISSCKT
ncbi:LOC443672 [Pelobates cultripes]|uniref:LOC443672, partial n=1 Tax=Pelobates cultripes TaxID=61616 RepID=A0AAD1R2H3_PELCU|nr:LOC443672 [Pelobates cultripes]